MCRHAAYVGPGIALTELMRDLPHSLYHQSFQARELITGSVCADGYGVAWYDADTHPDAARYVSTLPIWNDPNLAGFGPWVRSPVVLGAVRNATVEGSLDPANCAPFAAGRWTWSLNGFLADFDAAWADTFRTEWVSRERARGVRGRTDGEWGLAAFLTRLDEGADAASALQGLSRDIIAFGDEHGHAVYWDIVASDGQHVYATRAGNQDRQNSLYLLTDGREFPGAQVVASEPLYDDPEWEPVQDDTMLVLQADAPPVRLRV